MFPERKVYMFMLVYFNVSTAAIFNLVILLSPLFTDAIFHFLMCLRRHSSFPQVSTRRSWFLLFYFFLFAECGGAHTYFPSTWESETRGLGVPRPTWNYTVRPYVKNQNTTEKVVYTCLCIISNPEKHLDFIVNM